jgi:hypothetical protein
MIKNIVRTAIVLTLMLLTMTAWAQVVLSGYCGDPSVNFAYHANHPSVGLSMHKDRHQYKTFVVHNNLTIIF